MGIMDMFSNVLGGGNAAQQAPAPQPQPQPGNIPPNAGQTEPNNPTVPQGGAAAPANEPSPMDQFSDLWKPVETPAGEQQPNMFAVDPAKAMEAASKLNFTKVVTPELLQKMHAGGQEGVQASMEAMNKMVQTAFAQATQASLKIAEHANKQMEAKFQAELPNQIKRHQVSDTLRTENPALSHPAAQPLIDAVQYQIAQKFPNATAAELRTKAMEYVTNFAQIAAPQRQEQQSSKKTNETDWSAFL